MDFFKSAVDSEKLLTARTKIYICIYVILTILLGQLRKFHKVITAKIAAGVDHQRGSGRGLAN